MARHAFGAHRVDPGAHAQTVQRLCSHEVGPPPAEREPGLLVAIVIVSAILSVIVIVMATAIVTARAL